MPTLGNTISASAASNQRIATAMPERLNTIVPSSVTGVSPSKVAKPFPETGKPAIAV